MANHQGKGVGAVLVSESGQHYPMAAKLRFNCTNNMAEYEACILGLKMAVDMGYWRFRPLDSSGSRRMGCEKPENCTLRTVCDKYV